MALRISGMLVVLPFHGDAGVPERVQVQIIAGRVAGQVSVGGEMPAEID